MSFEEAFQATIRREGGFTLHEVEGDRGGQTYAGIARKFHPSWPGWKYIDNGDIPPTAEVREFYRREFWNRLNCDALPQKVAAHLFDFGVNAGWRTAAKLAQIVVGTTPDGVIGPKSVDALRAFDEDMFVAAYSIAKIKRYAEIVNSRRDQGKFLLGWINRTLLALE